MRLNTDHQRLEDIARQHAIAIVNSMSEKDKYQELVKRVLDDFRSDNDPTNNVDLEELILDMINFHETYCTGPIEEYLSTFNLTDKEIKSITLSYCH